MSDLASVRPAYSHLQMPDKKCQVCILRKGTFFIKRGKSTVQKQQKQKWKTCVPCAYEFLVNPKSKFSSKFRQNIYSQNSPKLEYLSARFLHGNMLAKRINYMWFILLFFVTYENPLSLKSVSHSFAQFLALLVVLLTNQLLIILSKGKPTCEEKVIHLKNSHNVTFWNRGKRI